MAAVFLKLLNLSISASWLVLAVLVLRLVSKRSPKWMNVLLWGIVALRLMLPFSIESALSLIPSAETVSPAVVQFDPAPTITSGVNIIDNAVNPSLSEHFAAVPTASVNPLYVWTEIAGWVWLIGLGAMLLYALVSYLRLRRRVSVSLCVRENIYLCDAISSPFILGVVKPRIYLPSGLDEVQRQNVLSHERAHLARRDHWWKPLGFALLAVYWFNPALWLAYTLLCRDIELACDERVIRTMDESAVKTYSTVLLACSMPRKAVITCPLAFGEVGVKERVRNALHYKKPAFWVVAASVAVCVVVAVCFLTNPEHETMKWAKNLRVDDVVRVELTIMPQATDKQYKDFNADEIAEAVALINKSSGRYISEPESLNGSTMTLYITTADGVQHTVTNNGNIYIRIDGDTYWSTHITWPYTEGDSPLPDSFQVGDTQAADANRFYVDDWSICIVGQWLRNLGTRVWLADNSDAYLSVVKQDSLADELAGLQNAGHAVEELDGYYRCVTQEGLSNTIVYLYPVLSNESCYWVETHWSYDNADESEVEVQATQLRMMAESFRVENGSSTADALIGSYNAIEQHQDSIVLDAEKWQGNYSKTFIVTDKTKVPISTLITVYFTYESNDNGGYSIVSIDSVKAEKNSGWTYVDNVATVNGDILYSNQRSEAVIPITYQASIGSGLEPQDCLIRLDLSQIDRLTLPSQDEIDNLHGDTASDDFSISGTVFSYGDESWDLAEQSPAITSLLNCDAVGQYVVITGHGGPKNALYFIFDTESRSFSNAFIGTHLVWQYDDLSTAAYVDGSNILSIDGRTLAELDLAENEYVYGLSYSQDGTVLTATIVSSEETERIVRLTLP
mgnify:CR=1 FL=1